MGGAAFSNEYQMGLVAGIIAIRVIFTGGLSTMVLECVAQAVSISAAKTAAIPRYMVTLPSSYLAACRRR
jgi:hypothetical protein